MSQIPQCNQLFIYKVLVSFNYKYLRLNFYLTVLVRIDVVQEGALQTVINNNNLISVDISSTDILISCVTGSESVELRSLRDNQSGLVTPNSSSVILENFLSSSSYEFSCTDPSNPSSGNATLSIETFGEFAN